MPPKAIHKRVHEWNNDNQKGFIFHKKKKIHILRDKEKNPLKVIDGTNLHIRFQNTEIIVTELEGRVAHVIQNAVLYVPRPKPIQHKPLTSKV